MIQWTFTNLVLVFLFRIGLITQSLPKNPVLGVDTKNDFKDPRSQSQDTVNRLESYVNSSAHVKETCDKFTNILHDIMNFAVSQHDVKSRSRDIGSRIER